MPIRTRPLIATGLENLAIQVTDDGSRTLIHTDTDDAYHSAAGAMAETRHVYLNNSGIADKVSKRQGVTVLEIGLGTGMGMLMTADAAVQAGCELHYVALENNWLPADVLRQLEPESWVQNHELVVRFLAFRERLTPDVDPGTYPWAAGEEQHVTIHAYDALQYQLDQGQMFDAVYFDPFAPTSNAELWQANFLSRLLPILKDDGRLVTYCVSRSVRDRMESAGFDVQRVPGPTGGKREVLIATKPPGC